MTESSSQNLSSPNVTPKEERDTQERPESPNPFLPADQVEFMFDEITFSTNNEYDHEDLTINPTQVFSVHNWALKPNQPKEPPFTDHMKAICNIDVLVESPNPTTSSKTEMKVPQGKNPGARSGLRR
ncbi:hypothetical protein Tco_1327825 [Tanacetum coccineum]